ncbi:sphingosine-1-phosphate phosphatase 2-like [Paramacrobiotus metropolitanus]|uniref:sphingosine-1-phosphate phosphatase 2-like n=1 Tax=Paramacrobiotus metropolitanus TaxID=2943436 RepID=UPI0024463E30|nr:sphingosine-1-phosphate phosphatase 2-like [Paramacrobiotus metropolitanus]
MESLQSILQFLNDPKLVYRFQNFCGLRKLTLTEDVDGRRTSFLKGDKGIDALFSAVDRDSRFISQDELVQRHIDHIKHSDEPATESPSSDKTNHARTVPKTSPKTINNTAKHLKHSKKEEKVSSEEMPQYHISSKALYYLFRFGSSLGYEAFYATFFPVWNWNIDGAVCRRVLFIWIATMYIGQLLKDILKLPRPSPRIVVQMEPHYVNEYGMPSTHAMVGFSVPFALLYFSSLRYQFPFILGLLVCSVWCLLICSSRVYLGMHSLLDILGGLLLVSILFAIILPFSDAIDNFLLTSHLAPFVILILYLTPSLYYPQSFSEEITKGQWGPTWADTVTILAVGYGVTTGSWLNYQMGLIAAPALTPDGALPLPPPYPIVWPSSQEWIYVVLRAVVGLACLATVRIAGKTMAYLAVCKLFGKDPNEVKGKNLVKVELPVKFFTYSAIGLAVSFFIPALFRGLHIARDTMYTEV